MLRESCLPRDQRDLSSIEELGSEGDERKRVLLGVSQGASRVRVALATAEHAKVILSRSAL